jgi:hypothetical protein
MLICRFDRAIVTSGKYFDRIGSGLYVTITLPVVSIALSFLVGPVIPMMRRSAGWFIAMRSDVSRVSP